ncbi:SDR family NAD(P)-dependent oxidoreductase [Oenococcus sp.]|uniref:SDR family NAD(P)-dependent oxidoreductase n=1 Tax=Oenococcus sp. TaxID=1979414 RepID=UPI0039E98464
MAPIQKTLINDPPFDYRMMAGKVMKHVSLHGKNAIVTGGYSGIGIKIVTKLSKAGAHVIVPERSVQKAKKEPRKFSNVYVYPLNLMDSSSIENFGSKINQNKIAIDLLICMLGLCLRHCAETIATMNHNYQQTI